MYQNIKSQLEREEFMNQFPNFYSFELKSLVKKLLILDSDKRPSFADIAKYEILDEIGEISKRIE